LRFGHLTPRKKCASLKRGRFEVEQQDKKLLYKWLREVQALRDEALTLHEKADSLYEHMTHYLDPFEAMRLQEEEPI